MNGLEIRNETSKPIQVTVCKAKFSGKLFIHIGKTHKGKTTIVGPHDYLIPEINEVDF